MLKVKSIASVILLLFVVTTTVNMRNIDNEQHFYYHTICDLQEVLDIIFGVSVKQCYWLASDVVALLVWLIHEDLIGKTNSIAEKIGIKLIEAEWP